MANAILGRKIGMTQVFSAGGEARGVTVVEAGPCVVVQIKTQERDGYDAIQLGFGQRKRVNDPQRGHMKQLGQFRYLREVRVDDPNEYTVGQTLGVDLFEEGEIVDVVGQSKGKGFAGGVKRYHFRGGPKTHGQSDRHRAPGSIGSGTTPGRVRKGLHMAGHMGDERVTVKNLRVFDTDTSRNVILIEGSVPGADNGLLRIRKTGKVSNEPKLERAAPPAEDEEAQDEAAPAEAEEAAEETTAEETPEAVAEDAPEAAAEEAPEAEAEEAPEAEVAEEPPAQAEEAAEEPEEKSE
jgi:large subunit ribosomal protein L3